METEVESEVENERGSERGSEMGSEVESEPTSVAITGASSLIGRSLAALLVARGDRVVAFQRGEFSTDPDDAELARHVEQHRGDVRDRAALDAALVGCDVVVHLAAKVGVVGDRDEYLAINVEGTRNVLAAAQAQRSARRGPRVFAVGCPRRTPDRGWRC